MFARKIHQIFKDHKETIKEVEWEQMIDIKIYLIINRTNKIIYL